MLYEIVSALTHYALCCVLKILGCVSVIYEVTGVYLTIQVSYRHIANESSFNEWETKIRRVQEEDEKENRSGEKREQQITQESK